MFKTLRIVFTILSAICVLAIFPVGAILNFTWAFITALGAGLFYLLMLICKKRQEFSEGKSKDEPDFFNSQENTKIDE